MQPNNFSTENENTETTSAIYDHTGTTMNATDDVDNNEEMEADDLFDGDEDDEDENDESDEGENEGTEEDGTPVLDEEDLEENDISEEEAEDVEWSEPK